MKVAALVGGVEGHVPQNPGLSRPSEAHADVDERGPLGAVLGIRTAGENGNVRGRRLD